MSKRKRSNTYNYLDKVLNMDNLYKSWIAVCKTCKNKTYLFEFEKCLNSNLFRIYLSLRDGTYEPGRFKVFMIYVPKKRIVMNQLIKDKIVNHFISEYIFRPLLEPKLIDTNVATRVGYGEKYASTKLFNYLNGLDKATYALSIDISKYFYNIDHNILMEMLSKDIYDKRILNIVRRIISETNKDYVNKIVAAYNSTFELGVPLYKNNKGLSIGAVTSQFLAIYYLNNIDHYIKEKLKCKYYIRYMDDFIILDKDKEKLLSIRNNITDKLSELNLSVNKKTSIKKVSASFNFLGIRYTRNNKLQRKFVYRNHKRVLNNLKEEDIIKRYVMESSYIGYFKRIGREFIRMNKPSIKEYISKYKKEYKDALVIFKDGIFYRVSLEDAPIIVFLLDYKITEDGLVFGRNAYQKVIDTLSKKKVSFIVADKNEVLLNNVLDKCNNKEIAKMGEEICQVDIIRHKIIKKLFKIDENGLLYIIREIEKMEEKV